MLQSNGLKGRISAKESITAKLNNKEVQVYPELEDLKVKPSGEQQTFKSNKYGYNTVIVEEVTSEEINIIPSANEQIKEGMFKKVTVAGDSNLISENIKKDVELFGVVGNFEGDSEYNAIISTPLKSGKSNNSALNQLITKISGNIEFDDTSTNYMFCRCINLKEAPLFDTSKVTTMSNMFYMCSKLTNVPLYNTSNVENMNAMFSSCNELTEVPLFDTSNVTNMNNMFNSCNKLTNVPLFDTSNVENMGAMFTACSELMRIPPFNTSNVTAFASMFYNCQKLAEVPLLDASKVTSIGYVFYNCSNLNSVGGFKNLGKAYTKTITNYSYYTIDLSYCNLLTHDSLMNVINNLYDLNLTYNVAGGGTLYGQTLNLGTTNKNKLTSEEIAIATNKGWNVS